MVIIKLPQVLIENDIHLDINSKHRHKIRHEFLDLIMYRKVVSHMI